MLDALSFTTGQIEKLVIKVKKLLKSALDNNEGVLAAKTAQLNTVDKKIEELEESYFRKDIELSTYKRWFAKHTAEKGHILDEIQKASTKRRSKRDKFSKLLPKLTSLGSLHERANMMDKHKLVRAVFKHGLVYSEGIFRTPFLHDALSGNYLNINNKGLLLVEQPLVFSGVNPVCSPDGNRTHI